MSPNITSEPHSIPAGDFSSWLLQTRKALVEGGDAEVACGECIGCCSSSYFIHIKSSDTQSLARINKDILVDAPGLPKGNVLMGFDKNGHCPMLVDGKCSIYAYRPQTCRNYDCRVFTGAGITAGSKDKAVINERVKNWQFSYPTEQDRKEHQAVQDAATFIRKNASNFPGGRVPSDPSQLAILAIKVHSVFLDKKTANAPNSQIASAIIEASRRFDAAMQG
jgi:Fe-S-cluster containining protein